MLTSKNRRSQYLSTLSVIGLLSLANMVGSTVSFAGQNAGDGSAGNTFIVADAALSVGALAAKTNCASGGGQAGASKAGSAGGTAAGGTAASGTGTAASSKSGSGTVAALARVTTEPLSVAVFNTGPAAAVDATGNVEAFVRNGQLFQGSQAVGDASQAQGFFADGHFQALTTIQGGVFAMMSDPVVGTAQNGFLDVMWVNSDGNVDHVFQTGFDPITKNSTWSAPVPITNFAVSQKQLSIPATSNTVAADVLPVPFLGSDLLGTKVVAAKVSGAGTKVANAAGGITVKAHDAGNSLCGASSNITVNVATTCINATGGVALAAASGGGDCGATLDVGPTPASNVALGTVNGQIHAFWIGNDGAVWGMTQNIPNDETSWSKPVSFGSNGLTFMGHPNVITNGKKMLVVLAANNVNTKNGNVGAIATLNPLQAASGDGCGAPPTPQQVKVSGTVQPVATSNVTGFINGDGRVELAYRGTDDGIWRIPSTVADFNDLQWSTPKQLGESGITITSDPAVAMNTDGKPQIFARDTYGDIITTERVSTDNGIDGVWDSHVDLVNSRANQVDAVGSPITVVMNKAKNPGGVQLFYAGVKARQVGGKVDAAINSTGGTTTVGVANPNTTQKTINVAAVDATGPSFLWTLQQNSAGSNPDVMKADAQGNVNTEWTIPHAIGGTAILNSVPKTVALCPGAVATQATDATSSAGSPISANSNGG